MAINTMELNWLKVDEKSEVWPPPGLLVWADKREDIFADPPRLNIKPLNGIKDVVGTACPEAILHVACHLPDRFRLADQPAMKMVGAAERGAQRRVYEYIGRDSGLDFRLGLTIHEGIGTWSSEPHYFELEALKSLKPMRFWEQFAYITQPPNQWGIQTRQGFLKGELMHDIQLIQDGDILDIPLGVHMVVASPGTKLAYIWVYQAEDISAAEKF